MICWPSGDQAGSPSKVVFWGAAVRLHDWLGLALGKVESLLQLFDPTPNTGNENLEITRLVSPRLAHRGKSFCLLKISGPALLLHVFVSVI